MDGDIDEPKKDSGVIVGVGDGRSQLVSESASDEEAEAGVILTDTEDDESKK